MQNSLDAWLFLPDDDIFIGAAKRTAATQVTWDVLYILLPNKKSDEKLLLSHIFIFLSSSKHIPDSKVINMNKGRHLRGTFNLQNWGLHQSLLDLLTHTHTHPKNIFSQLPFVFFPHWLLLPSNFTTLMLLQHALMTPMRHKANNAHGECKHITANLAF